MEKSITEMREECICWYMERGNTRETAELIVPNKERRIVETYNHMLRMKQGVSKNE